MARNISNLNWKRGEPVAQLWTDCKHLRMRRTQCLRAGAAAIIAIAVLAITIPAMRPHCTRVSGEQRVEIPIANLARDAASFFCYDDGGQRLRFILARDNDGAVHSVLDACHQCSSSHNGYTASHGEVVCRLCGNKYPIRALEAGKASCVPLALPTRQHDGMVEVMVADLRQGRQLF
jgi:uncharacterized membrane protein